MKWILILILIFIIMIIAYSISEQYKEKFDFYNNLKIFLLQFKLNISFKKEKIIEFLNKVNSKKYFNIFICEYKNYLKTNIINLENIKILDGDERKQLENLIKSIGLLDSQNEILQLDLFIQEVDEKLKRAEKDKNKLCPMILKLSLLFAIGLAIILI